MSEEDIERAVIEARLNTCAVSGSPIAARLRPHLDAAAETFGRIEAGEIEPATWSDTAARS